MEFEEARINIQSVPPENRQALQRELMNYFPFMVELLLQCYEELSDFYDLYIEPAEQKDGIHEDELPLRPDLIPLLSRYHALDNELESMFEKLRGKKAHCLNLTPQNA